MNRFLYIILVMALGFVACNSSDTGNKKPSSENKPKAETKVVPKPETPAKADPIAEDQQIQDYLKANNIDAKKLDSGLYLYIEKQGTGDFPKVSNTATVHYRGYFLNNGKEFDSSYTKNKPMTYPIAKFVDGWKIGLPYFNRGTKGKLFVPSALGYGQRGFPGAIPPNAVLGFDIEMIDFK